LFLKENQDISITDTWCSVLLSWLNVESLTGSSQSWILPLEKCLLINFDSAAEVMAQFKTYEW